MGVKKNSEPFRTYQDLDWNKIMIVALAIVFLVNRFEHIAITSTPSYKRDDYIPSRACRRSCICPNFFLIKKLVWKNSIYSHFFFPTWILPSFFLGYQSKCVPNSHIGRVQFIGTPTIHSYTHTERTGHTAPMELQTIPQTSLTCIFDLPMEMIFMLGQLGRRHWTKQLALTCKRFYRFLKYFLDSEDPFLKNITSPIVWLQVRKVTRLTRFR